METANPSFRVLEVDEETMLPLKVHTYVLNITAEDPKWFKHHEMTEYYEIKDLSPKSIEDLANTVANIESLALKYLRTFNLEAGKL